MPTKKHIKMSNDITWQQFTVNLLLEYVIMYVYVYVYGVVLRPYTYISCIAT
jgi:hypothetical protein